MRLFPEHRRLDTINGTLRSEEPSLAAKYDIFTRLTRGEGDPPSEMSIRPRRAWRRQVSDWWWRCSRRLRANGPVRA